MGSPVSVNPIVWNSISIYRSLMHDRFWLRFAPAAIIEIEAPLLTVKLLM
jgi:hypothetical protein